MKPISIDHRPVIIPMATLNLLLKQKNPLRLIGVYCFYYYTAVQQRTSQPKCSVGYVAKGLKISTDTARRYKLILVKLDLIENVGKKGKRGHISTYTIQVKHLPGIETANLSQMTTESSNARQSSDSYQNHLLCRPTFGTVDDVKDFFKESAVKLVKVIQIHRKICRKVNLTRWTTQLRRLHTTGSIGKQRMKRVLKWYIANFGRKFVPCAYSALSFANKFPQIEDAMQRAGGDIKISLKAKKLGSLMERKHEWPSGSADQLLFTIQKSLSNYEEFLKKYRRLLIRIKLNPRKYHAVASFAKHLNAMFVRPPQFISEWMEGVYNQISRRKNWDGDLLRFSFDEDTRMFCKMGERWANEYCNDSKRWRKFMDCLSEGK